MMRDWFNLLRFSVCLLFLSVASIYDVRTREVPNSVWLFFAPIGLILTLISLVLNNWNFLLINICITSIAATIVLSFALFYLDLFGGADAKALICLALSMPVYPSIRLIKPILGSYWQTIPLLPPLSTFNNAVLIASLLIFLIISRNLEDLAKNRMRIFEGIEEERTIIKLLAFITGFRVEASKLRTKKHHYIVLEKFERKENGVIRRRLKVFQRINNSKEEISIPEEIDGKIWVTIGLPFIVFITLGFALTIFIGDLIFLLLDLMI